MMVEKMTAAFQKAEGGLFSKVLKADVGDTTAASKDGVTMMAWADPFFPSPSTPEHVIHATVEALESGTASHYTQPIGNPRLKEEIAKKLQKVNHLEVDPQRNILITPGSDSGLFYAMLPFLHPGDEVMIPDPSYPNNVQNTEILGGIPVMVPLREEDDFQIDVREFEKRLTNKTKMIVLTNPNNPTTTVFKRERLESLAEFAVKNDLVVVVDQAFEQPVFDGREMVTMAALDGMWERTLTVFSLSKGMGLSGFRVGYLVTNEEVMDKLYGAAVSVLGATNTAAQIGAIAALQDDRFLEEYGRRHEARRNMVYRLLKDVPGILVRPSQSGILTWINVAALGTGAEVAERVRQIAGVAVNAGIAYGPSGENYIRIVHSVLGDDRQLEKAIQALRNCLLQMAKEQGIT